MTNLRQLPRAMRVDRQDRNRPRQRRQPAVHSPLLLFLLGGVFLHFLLAGARTFYTQNAELEPGAWVAQLLFVFGGTIPLWFLGLRHPIQAVNGVIAALIMATALSLYEWTRHTIRSRRFGLAWGVFVPEAVCDEGPYRYIRHPIYLSYFLAFLAALVAVPHWLTAAMLGLCAVLFTLAAIDDERNLAASALAADYAAYRERTGMFLPKLGR